MIIVELHNNIGIGNQLFIYSRAYSLARDTNSRIVIFSRMNHSKRPYILDIFNLDNKYIKKVIKLDFIKIKIIWKIFNDCGKYLWIFFPQFYHYKEEVGKHRCLYDLPRNKKNYWISGNFECYEYFDKYKSEIINQFKPFFEFSNDLITTLDKIKNDENSIALHIRQGDFVTIQRCLSLEYYNKAIDYCRKNISNCKFYLVSEEKKIIEYYKGIEDVIVVSLPKSKYKDVEEWLCLLNCHNHIIGNSTYSWWAAYLSSYEKKQVFIPCYEFYCQAEGDGKSEEYEKFFCKEWIQIKK